MKARTVWLTALAPLGLIAGTGLGTRAQVPPASPPPEPPRSPVIARVEGRPITEEDFDRLAQPYFARLRAQFREGFDDQLQALANRNVLNELIRREVLALEARRRNLRITEEDTDKILRQDPFFHTDGRFDPGKFIQFKVTPGSNYLNVLPMLRDLAAAAKMESLVHAECTPSAATVRAEWRNRNERVQFRYLALSLRDMSLEPEASEEERVAYYTNHPEQFERKARIRLRYLSLPLPPLGDSLRPARVTDSIQRARGLASALRAGSPLDSIAVDLGDVKDTGLFEWPAAAIPGMGQAPELISALAAADSDTVNRVVGPVLTADAVVVGIVEERHPRELPPMTEVLAEVKRRADLDARRNAQEAERRAYYEAHPDSFRGPQATLVRVTLARDEVRIKEPKRSDADRWYRRHGATLFPPGEEAVSPALDDSLREVVLERIAEDRRADAAARSLERLARHWRDGKDLARHARSAGAAIETLTFAGGSLADTVFPAPFLDSLLAGTAGSAPGSVRGPRRFERHAALWRVERLDSTFVSPYESVLGRIDQAVRREKQRQEEVEARAHYEANKANYQTQPRYVIDYVSVEIPPPDSVAVSEEAMRAHYDSHLDAYRQEEQVRARHILIDPARTPGGDEAARARADSLLEAIDRGEDFAELAREFSHDPGSGRAGGDLGFFPRGRMVKEFSDTSFALEPGRVSRPVKTQFGYHLIKVEERKEESTTPFDQVRDGIRAQLSRTIGDSTARNDAEATLARLTGDDEAEVMSAAAGATRSAPFATHEPVPGIGLVQGLGQDLEKLPIGTWAPKLYRSANAYVLVRPAQFVPPGQADFETAQAQAIEDLRTARRKELLAGKVEAVRRRLQAGVTLDSVAALFGGTRSSGPLPRSAVAIPGLGREPRIVSTAFSLEPGEVSDTLATAQGVAWIAVEEKKPLEGATFTKDREAIHSELLTQKYEEWIEDRKKAMKIEILRADLREAQPLRQTVTISPGGKR